MKVSTAPELEPLPTEVDGVAVTGLEGAQPPFPEERSAAMVRYAEAFNDVPKGVSQHVVLVTHGEVWLLRYSPVSSTHPPFLRRSEKPSRLSAPS